MKSMPRILPLVGVAIGGVLAINALAGARDLPNLVSGAKAWAEEAAKPVKKSKAKDPAADAAQTGDAVDASTKAALPPPSIKPVAVCAPTAAELAKEAGLSPAELQVLQNLGARRDQLDQQQSNLNTQLALLAAAEEKLDAKAKALEGLKGDVQNLLNQANGREDAEIDRLVMVYQAMKPKDAAPQMTLLDDSVRLPIAAKMKPRALSAILAQMPPAEAKKVTEALAKRFSAAQTLAQSGIAQANPATPAPGAQPNQTAAATPAPAKAAAAPAKPVKHAARKPRPRKHAPASAQAKAAPAAQAPATPAAAGAPASTGG